MEKKQNVPALRFQGFSGEWKRKTLGDFGNVAMNRRIFKEQTSETGEIPFYKIGTFGKEPDAYISRQLFEEYKAKYPYPDVGDILLSAAGSIGKTVEYTGKDEYFQDSNIVWLKHDERLDNPFLKYFYSKVKWGTLEGGTVKRLYNKILLETEIVLPEIIEQKKIGKFFASYDRMIAHQEGKIRKLQQFRQAMLTKLFPREGAAESELRFRGFSGPWIKRSLKEISMKSSKRNADRQYTETFTNSAEFGVINQRDFFDHDISNAENTGNYYVVENDDFVYNPRISTTAPVGPINRNRLGRTGIMSPLYMVFKTHDVDRTYLEWFFKTTVWHSFMRLNGDTGARADRFSIKEDLFFEMPIPCPSLEEQKRIGKFFDQLDSYISLQQKKLKRMQRLKAALLEKLFV